jgi:hypothetical protein
MERTRLILGIVFIIFAITGMVDSFIFYGANSYFWICYPALLLIGLALLINNNQILQSQFIILAVVDFIWTIDFISVLFGRDLFGVTSFVLDQHIVPRIVSMQHLFVVPIIFFFIYKKKINYYIPIISAVEVAILYVFTIMLTEEKSNINCVFRSCVPIEFSASIYPYVWFGLYFAFILIAYGLMNLNYYIINKK